MNWDPVKDEALWKILSGAAKKQIDCEDHTILVNSLELTRTRGRNVGVDLLLQNIVQVILTEMQRRSV